MARMLANVRKYKLMPEEVYSECNCLANDGTLSKVLCYDIVSQLHRPAGLASVNADYCYNRIAHPMASNISQAFSVPPKAIALMLSTIQRMQFFLLIGYGDSKDYVGGDQEGLDDPIRTQGMCQGNRASPAAWLVTSIPIITAQKRRGHGAHFIAPILGQLCHLARGLFVNDTNFIHIDVQRVKTALEAHDRLQELVINWGKLLMMATGGALKPAKCTFYLLSFHWKVDGTWVYESKEVNPDFSIGVPMLDGSLEEIEHLLFNKAIRTLGLMTCPSKSNTMALDRK
jgi:hypothetical protein